MKDSSQSVVLVSWAAGFAPPEEGLHNLLGSEGGCVSLREACSRFYAPGSMACEVLIERIRNLELIAYEFGDGRYAVPVWQFHPAGGLLDGLPEVLAAIREKLPSGGSLVPFAFFLQEDPVTDGKTPLDALRDGKLQQVLKAVNARAG